MRAFDVHGSQTTIVGTKGDHSSKFHLRGVESGLVFEAPRGDGIAAVWREILGVLPERGVITQLPTLDVGAFGGDDTDAVHTWVAGIKRLVWLVASWSIRRIS
jgi:hypothetical protein